MNWNTLTDIAQIENIKQASYTKPQLIFKHSTTCSISGMALNRLERSTDVPSADCWLLHLLQHRAISNAIATTFSVQHESPQVLIIKNGECTYDESHMGINMPELLEQTA